MLTALIDKVALGDSLEILRQIQSDSVDMSFADPPFNLDQSWLIL
jgi:DNA modification methylase